MKKKIVLVDMDGTIADFRSSFEREVLKNGWEILEEENKMHIKVKNDHNKRKRIFINSQRNFYLNLKPIEGAVDAVKEIMASEGFDLFFCTTPSKNYKNCVLEKYKWIEKYFGFRATKNIILTRDKTLIYGDYLIDDKPEILGENKKPNWEHIYFTQPYNKNFERKRIDNWKDWNNIIK